MSASNSGNSQSSSPQASSQALLAELHTAADRARDERLKLARLVKHSTELPIGKPTATDAGTTPDARFVALSQQIEQLEQTVSEKLQSLDQVQQDIESRSQYLESLRHTITDTTRAFVTQVEQAQHFKAHVDAAKQHVKMSAGRVVEDVRQHLAEYEGPIAKRIEQLTEMDEQIDKRIARMQQMHKQAGEAVDQHLLAALRTAKEQASDLAQPVKEQVDKHLLAQAKIIEDAIEKKIADLDVDVEDALAPLTKRFDEIVAEAQNKADLLGETLPDRMESIVAEQVEKMRVQLIEKANNIVKGVDEATLDKVGQHMQDRVAKSLDGYLAQADEHAGGYVDGLINKLNEAREEVLISFQESLQAIEADTTTDREQMIGRLNDEVDRLNELADQRIAHAQEIVEGASDGIHRRATAAVESAIRVADKKIDEYESGSVDRLRAIDQGIEHGIGQSFEKLADHERAANECVQRIEQDASARVMKVVELAEKSGRSVAESLAALSESAQATAAKAQADLDEKLQAFETISASALQTAEKVLRTNITELRDTSRSMIEVVSKQVKAQAEEIEPQTKEVIAQAEQTMRRRIGELRDDAQSMVELTVSRLEAQLNDVKTKAQHTAFKGIEPKDAA